MFFQKLFRKGGRGEAVEIAVAQSNNTYAPLFSDCPYRRDITWQSLEVRAQRAKATQGVYLGAFSLLLKEFVELARWEEGVPIEASLAGRLCLEGSPG